MIETQSAPPEQTGGTSPRAGGRQAAQQQWRVVTSAIALLMLVVVNIPLQLNRRYFDLLSDNTYGLGRVQTCESLGRVPDALYMGSSRTANGIDPRVIDPIISQQVGHPFLSCNAGIGGSTFEQDYYAFKRFIEDGYVPKLVIETLWDYNVYARAPVRADDSELVLAQVLKLADIADAGALSVHYGSGVQRWVKEADYIAQKAIPLYGDRLGVYVQTCAMLRVGNCAQSVLGVTGFYASTYGVTGTKGFSPLYGKQGGAESNCSCHFVFGGRQVTYLEAMVKLAARHHVRMVLVHTPLDSTYYPAVGLDQPQDWNAYITYWARFAVAHQLLFYDHSHASELSESDFWNSNHLTVTGAGKFSQWLAVNVIGPAVAQFPAAASSARTPAYPAARL